MSFFFKLVVALLASASLLSAAAFPRVADVHEVLNTIQRGDDPQAIAALLGGCNFSLAPPVVHYFEAAIEHGRIHTLHYLLSRLTIGMGRERDEGLTDLLCTALWHDNTQIAKIVMAQAFQIIRYGRTAIWRPPRHGRPRNLAALLEFVSAHPAQAADLVPILADFEYICDEEDLALLIDLARHCESLTRQRLFNPTAVLNHIILFVPIPDEDMVGVVARLLQEGTETTPELFGRLQRAHMLRVLPRTIELVRDWTKEDIKVTEEEADRVQE